MLVCRICWSLDSCIITVADTSRNCFAGNLSSCLAFHRNLLNYTLSREYAVFAVRLKWQNHHWFFFTGEEIAFYFAWMSYFRWALCIPSVFGIFVYFWRNPGITVDDNFLLPLYALFMVVWAVFFIVVGLLCMLIIIHSNFILVHDWSTIVCWLSLASCYHGILAAGLINVQQIKLEIAIPTPQVECCHMHAWPYKRCHPLWLETNI
jgi:hypothetical protein